MSASISVALLATAFRLMLLVERWRCRCCAPGADISLCVAVRPGAVSRIDNAPARSTGEGGQAHVSANWIATRSLTVQLFNFCITGLRHG